MLPSHPPLWLYVLNPDLCSPEFFSIRTLFSKKGPCKNLTPYQKKKKVWAITFRIIRTFFLVPRSLEISMIYKKKNPPFSNPEKGIFFSSAFHIPVLPLPFQLSEDNAITLTPPPSSTHTIPSNFFPTTM